MTQPFLEKLPEKRMVLDPYLTADTNVNSKWITFKLFLNVRAETRNTEETQR